MAKPRFVEPKEVARVVHAYVDLKQSTAEIGRRFGCDATTVRHLLRKNGVTMRTIGAARRALRESGAFDYAENTRRAWNRGVYDQMVTRQRGPGHPFFGRTHSADARARMSAENRERAYRRAEGPYPPDWPRISAAILTRDRRECLVCHRSTGKLAVHHVNHDRGDNSSTNLMTLCTRCHLGYHRCVPEFAERVARAHRDLVSRLGATC
jgi:hypothetical protein